MKAVITGIGGQDGVYMARRIAQEGAEVIGLTTDPGTTAGLFLDGKVPNLTLVKFDYRAPGNFSNVVKEHRPDIIFNFAAKSTGQGMFDDPYDMSRINGSFVVDILEYIRNFGGSSDVRFCQASSSEMFGHVDEWPQNENTPLRPKSPYGAAKAYAHHMVNVYRNSYDIHCSSAILYNHESCLRTPRFVTKKIAQAAAKISLGLETSLELGDIEASRDWGYAPEYVEAMYRMALSPKAADYIVATGRLNTVRRLCEIAFGHVGLDYSLYVRANSTDFRAAYSDNLRADPSSIERDLGWRATRTLEEIMVEMVDGELRKLVF